MKTVDDYMNAPNHIALVRDEDAGGNVGWVASVAELPGCLAQGNTAGDAATRIREAMEGWLEFALEKGAAIPDPASDASYSGKILMRVPASLHERLVWEAGQEGVSLNQLLLGIVAGAVGWRHTANSGQPRAKARRSA